MTATSTAHACPTCGQEFRTRRAADDHFHRTHRPAMPTGRVPTWDERVAQLRHLRDRTARTADHLQGEHARNAWANVALLDWALGEIEGGQ